MSARLPILLLLLVALEVPAADWSEDFSSDPSARGWRVFGDASLFSWNAVDHQVEVTWDTERTNSFFYHSLGTILARDDNFTLGFDLRLDSVDAVAQPGKSYAFEIAVGLLNRSAAFATNFFRGDGVSSPNLVEFDYFPDTGYGETVSPAVVSSNSVFRSSFVFPYEFLPGEWYRVNLRYAATNQALIVTVTNTLAHTGIATTVPLGSGFGDFRVDTLAISSYADGTANGHVRVQGAMDNITMTLPTPPVTNLAGQLVNGIWSAGFIGRTNWLYTLERTGDLQTWNPVTSMVPTTNGPQQLVDAAAPVDRAYYRVRAERP